MIAVRYILTKERIQNEKTEKKINTNQKIQVRNRRSKARVTAYPLVEGGTPLLVSILSYFTYRRSPWKVCNQSWYASKLVHSLNTSYTTTYKGVIL